MTRDDGERGWRGYFSFRSQDGEVDGDEVRTADIFLEATEGAIYHKARGLGRPMLSGLLASALHTLRREGREPPRLRSRFRDLLSENSLKLAGGEGWGGGPGAGAADPAKLRSLYASYRLDQVAHLIALLDPAHFREAVDRILEGRSIDFGGKDRVQFAILVVEHLEGLLPLPPFEVWAADYLARPGTYQLYAHTLHRVGRLP